MTKKNTPFGGRKKFQFAWFLGGFLFFYFVLLNIIASQTISPIYFGLAQGGKQSAGEFLKNIQTAPEFPDELTNLTSQFGPEMRQVVFADERKRKVEINRLEDLLRHNPYARDVLYDLSILYQQSGDRQKAADYMKRSKEVDPDIR